jgi:hypothetical protein
MALVDLSEWAAPERAKSPLDEPVPRYTLVVLGLVVAVPLLALLAGAPVARGWAAPRERTDRG